MKIYSEISLENFDAWSGGEDTLDVLKEKDLCDKLQDILESDIFPDGCSDTELNDFLWFEDDYIAELLGFRNWEDLENDGEEDEDDEEDDEEEDDEEEINYELLQEYLEKKLDFDTYCNHIHCENCPFNNAWVDCIKAYESMFSGSSLKDALEQSRKSPLMN